MVRTLTALACALTLTWPISARSQETRTDPNTIEATSPDAGTQQSALESEARQVFLEGLEHLRGERWAQAETSFRRSVALVPRPSALYNLALVLFKQRRSRESLSILDQLLDIDRASEDVRYRGYAEALAPHVRAQLTTLKFALRPSSASVWIDGELVVKKGSPRAVLVDPGWHRIEARADGYPPKTLDLVLKAGQELEQVLELAPLQPRAPVATRAPHAVPAARTQTGASTLGPWITIGIGGVLLAGAVVTGILAKQADDDFVEQCPTLERCDRGLEGLQQDARRLGRISDLLFLSGGVAVTGGGGWLFLSSNGQGAGAGGNARMVQAAVTAHY